MLTAEQQAIRATGIGASEIAAVAGLSRFASPLDVWLRKGTPTRPPVIEDNGDEGKAEVGSVLEESAAELYRRRLGRRDVVRSQATLRHPDQSWLLATPDAYLGPPGHPEGLAEFKVVGFHMRDDWTDGVPDYVRAQVEQQLFVTRLPFCDVAALIGTDFQIWRCESDPELAAMLAAIGAEFWNDYVLANMPPPVGARESHREYLRKRFLRANEDMIDATTAENAEEIARRIARLVTARANAALHAAEKEEAECAVMALIGERAGIAGSWGKATWRAPAAGALSYKSIAEELAGGVLSETLLAKHRGAPARRFSFYPAKGGAK